MKTRLLLFILLLIIAAVSIVGAIIWFSRSGMSVEALAIKKTLDDMAKKVEANEKGIKAAEQLVLELKNEQIVYVEKLAEANLKEKGVEEDFKKALEDYNQSVRKANRLREELNVYAGESDLNKVVEIGGVNASLREHQINLSHINTETSLKAQTVDLKRQYYESTKQLVENSRATIDKLKFDIMEWENKVVQFKIILQNNKMQRAFLADQAEMYAGSKSKLESLMATAKSIEEAFLKQQEVDNIISEMNSAKTNHEWEDIPEPSQVQDQIPEGGWKEMQYDF